MVGGGGYHVEWYNLGTWKDSHVHLRCPAQTQESCRVTLYGPDTELICAAAGDPLTRWHSSLDPSEAG